MTDHIIEQLRPLAVAIDTLVSDPANARLHDERNIEAIKGSLAQFGQRKPIVVKRQGNIVIAGNGTMAAAKALGWDTIAAVMVDDDATMATAYAIADNRTAELARWDDQVLGQLLGGLDDTQIDMTSLGFTDADMTGLIRSIENINTEENKDSAKESNKCPTCGHVTK